MDAFVDLHVLKEWFDQSHALVRAAAFAGSIFALRKALIESLRTEADTEILWRGLRTHARNTDLKKELKAAALVNSFVSEEEWVAKFMYMRFERALDGAGHARHHIRATAGLHAIGWANLSVDGAWFTFLLTCVSFFGPFLHIAYAIVVVLLGRWMFEHAQAAYRFRRARAEFTGRYVAEGTGGASASATVVTVASGDLPAKAGEPLMSGKEGLPGVVWVT